MTDTLLSWNETVDPKALNAGEQNYFNVSRDIARTPFHWDNTENAGFTNGNKTWLPVNADYYYKNVQIQQQYQRTHLSIYKKLVQLRKDSVFVNGTFESTVFENDVFAYQRYDIN